MQKIKIPPPEFSTTYKPPAAYVVRLEVIEGCFVARYFQVVDQVDESDKTVRDSMKPISLQPPLLMRKVETQRTLVLPSAVTDNAEVQDKLLMDIGYQVFAPTSGSNSVCGFGERQDFALWCLPFTHQGKVGEPFNHFTEGEIVKGKVTRIGRLRDAQPIFIFYADVANAPLTSWKLHYVDFPTFILEDATAGSWTVQTQAFDYISLLPTFESSAPSSVGESGSANVSITLKRNGTAIAYNGEIEVDAISGYVPKRRATVVNGVASIKVMPLGLSAGDSVRIKVGTRNVSGLADVTIPVV
jgi:hypothetical protein